MTIIFALNIIYLIVCLHNLIFNNDFNNQLQNPWDFNNQLAELAPAGCYYCQTSFLGRETEVQEGFIIHPVTQDQSHQAKVPHCDLSILSLVHETYRLNLHL